jgi:hypothetical protein
MLRDFSQLAAVRYRQPHVGYQKIYDRFRLQNGQCGRCVLAKFFKHRRDEQPDGCVVFDYQNGFTVSLRG